MRSVIGRRALRGRIPHRGMLLFFMAWVLTLIVPTLPLRNRVSAQTPTGVAPQATGFTIKVNTLKDEWSTEPDLDKRAKTKCSLREALQATVTNNPEGNQGCGAVSIANFDEYTFDLVPGTYTLSLADQLPNVMKQIMIDGKGAVTIDGGAKAGRKEGIFIVASGQLTLNKLKLQYGHRPFGGAIWMKGGEGKVSAAEVEFFRNLADNGSGNGDGGAVAVDLGTFNCFKSKFLENAARHNGGAISSGGVDVVLNRCEFMRNHAEVNGGAYAGYGGSPVTHPIIYDSKFRENWVYQTNVPANWPTQYAYTDDQSGGGAIYNKGYMEIERTEFFKNYTQRSKGGGAIYNQGELGMLDVAFSDNRARKDGPVPHPLGGAILNDSTLVMRRASLHGNEAVRGGAIQNRQGGQLYLINSTVADNLANFDGGVVNGYNFVVNGQQVTNNGGEVHVYHSTLVRANDNSPESPNISNRGNGNFYLANSVVDSFCVGLMYSHGGNVFKSVCPRQSADNNTDLTLTDVILPDTGKFQLEGLSNNGGPNLPEAQFLSVKVGGQSPAVDLARDLFCIDPALLPAYMLNKDQVQAQRPNGTKCDSGALEVGSNPPQYYSEPSGDEGQVIFPLTVFGSKFSATTDLFIQNKGGGLFTYKAQIMDNAGGIFSLESEPNGGLGKDQSVKLTLRCTPTAVDRHIGMLQITTDLPDQPTVTYYLDCKMTGDPSNPAAWPSTKPGPTSVGKVDPGAQTMTQIKVGNGGANPMAATINWKDAVADTLKFMPMPFNVALKPELPASLAPSADVTIPPGATLNVAVICEPTQPGLYAGTLEIKTEDPVEPVLSYAVSCEGAFPALPEPLVAQTLNFDLDSRIMGLALSPDGSQLLSGHWDNNEVVAYGIPNPETGNLNPQGKFSHPNMSKITGIRYSADLKHVYYSSADGDGVVGVSRGANGSMSHLQTITKDTVYVCGFNPVVFCPIDAMDGARALDISPDDRNLYVTADNDDTLTVLARNPVDGKLLFVEKFTSIVESVDVLNGAFGVIVSSDGRNVYVAARDGDTVVAFTRQADGRLRYLTHYKDEVGGVTGLNAPVQLALSPDGKFLYVASRLDNAVQIFRRNPADGFIEPVEAVAGVTDPYALQISHDADGARLLVALYGGDGVLAYARDRATGKLTLLPGQGALTMNAAVNLVSSTDDRHVYVALFDGKGVQRLRTVRHAPVLQNTSPASRPVGSDNSTLTINGDRFYPDSVVLWNDSPLPTTFVNPTQLTAQLTADLLTTAGTASIKVRTGTPGGGDSAAHSFAITAPNEVPVPSVASLEPPAAPIGGQALNVIVNGAGFVPQSQVLLNGSQVETIYVSGVLLLAKLAADDLGEAGPLVITVSNGAVTSTSTALQAQADNRSTPFKFTAVEPNMPAQAAVSGFEPGSLSAGSGEQWIKVFGHNFSQLAGAQSVVYWNGTPRETAVLDANTLLLHLTAEDVAAASLADVEVHTPGVPPSGVERLSILAAGTNPRPQVNNAFIDQDENSTLVVVSGADFVAGAVVRFNGSERPTNFINAYQLEAEVAVSDVLQNNVVQVFNPEPSGGLSNDLYFAAERYVVYLPVIVR